MMESSVKIKSYIEIICIFFSLPIKIWFMLIKLFVQALEKVLQVYKKLHKALLVEINA